jgi:hypothetical protein
MAAAGETDPIINCGLLHVRLTSIATTISSNESKINSQSLSMDHFIYDYHFQIKNRLSSNSIGKKVNFC